MAKSVLSNQRSERKLPPPPKAAPWLVFPHGKDRKSQTFCNIFEDLDTRKSFKKFIPELSIKLFWQKNSHQGWLIVLCCDEEDPKFNYGEFFLWNPVSLETIRLPSLPDLVDDYSVKDCVLSSPPQISRTGGAGDGFEGGSSSSSLSSSGSNNSSFSSSFSSDDDAGDNSMVYILYDGDESPDILIYCHPGEKEWRIYEFVGADQSFQSMFYFKGKLCMMCLNNAYIEMAIQHGSDIEDAETLSIGEAISAASNFRRELVAGGLEYRRQSYYIEAFGEVFKIYRNYFPRGIYQNCVASIEISRLDFSSMTWEDVKSMDDHVFFLTDNTQLSCLASDLGLTKGCVYFTQDEEMSLYKYDLEDDSILLSLPCPNLPAPWYTPEWLMISPTPRFDGCRRTTYHVLGKDEDIHKVIRATGNITVDQDGDEKEDITEAKLWINDDHMVWLISNYLHTLDYIHLRGVSKKYQTMLNPRRSSYTRTVQTTDLSPWLVFPKYDPAVNSFVNPMHNNENYLMNIPELLKGFRIRFSKDGWLLLSKGKTLLFYNPFTKSTATLPELPDSYHHYAFTGISFSSLPTSSDCVVFGIGTGNGDGVEILFIKRGDERWTHDVFDNIYLPPRRKNVDFELNFNNPVFYHGAFYCLDLHGTLGVFKLEHGISWEILAMVAPPNCEFIYKSFLVECDGKLMAVLVGHLGKWVRVFRLIDTEIVWVEVKHLGQHMLCVSNTSCVSAIAPASRMENKIYFPRLHNEGILYYSLDTCMYRSFGSKHSAKDYRDSKENLHCSWIEPNWSETCDYYLDWLNI